MRIVVKAGTSTLAHPTGRLNIQRIDVYKRQGRRTRTPDLLITNQLLYQLSYTSNSNSKTDYNG